MELQQTTNASCCRFLYKTRHTWEAGRSRCARQRCRRCRAGVARAELTYNSEKVANTDCGEQTLNVSERDGHWFAETDSDGGRAGGDPYLVPGRLARLQTACRPGCAVSLRPAVPPRRRNPLPPAAETKIKQRHEETRGGRVADSVKQRRPNKISIKSG